MTRHLNHELSSSDWDVSVLHYLGLDHIGHLAGPSSPLIKPKLQEMSEIIGRIKEDLFNKVHFNRSCYQIMFLKPFLLSSRGRMACHLCWLS